MVGIYFFRAKESQENLVYRNFPTDKPHLYPWLGIYFFRAEEVVRRIKLAFWVDKYRKIKGKNIRLPPL
ncbi:MULTISPECIES: hypothetical protein [unclassified Okeania]|uniref:hypothetical protein n=1 Tax=unclassified Okeania TaxID=2634635 RepID=UPI0013BDFA79|nr:MULTISPECIES: hypothetical protein [unclassified Okeania]NES76339.1 hypothetical protein [Okeania sp. SIO1H4]NET13319.1 hypothetical protein [Okeania sp. SIO1H6]NET19785.1 hypothetical protein [Okeania sp. SIO1H5]NET77747.1 hypothetical protein [Okeania sp. SIO1F9]